jgi:hypothetical protein
MSNESTVAESLEGDNRRACIFALRQSETSVCLFVLNGQRICKLLRDHTAIDVVKDPQYSGCMQKVSASTETLVAW